MLAGDPHAFDHGLLGPQLQLRVVGVLRGASDVIGRSDPPVYGTPAFDREYRGRSRLLDADSRRPARAKGTQPRSSTTQSSSVSYPDSGSASFDAEAENKPAGRTTHTLAIGLSVFALIAGLVSVLVVNQAVTRHVNGADADHPALSALGFTRPQRIVGVCGHGRARRGRRRARHRGGELRGLGIDAGRVGAADRARPRVPVRRRRGRGRRRGV